MSIVTYFKLSILLTCCDSLTSNKCISSVPRITFAKGEMIGNITGSIYTTQSRTRIFALLSNTCQVSRTFGVDHTFRLAFNVGVPNVSRYTGT